MNGEGAWDEYVNIDHIFCCFTGREELPKPFHWPENGLHVNQIL